VQESKVVLFSLTVHLCFYVHICPLRCSSMNMVTPVFNQSAGI